MLLLIQPDSPWLHSNKLEICEIFQHNLKSDVLLSLYKGCRMKRKQNSNLYMLQLSTQDKHVNYNKDDIWIIDSGKT